MSDRRGQMDLDPELDVTLSDGRVWATFRIAAVPGAPEAWAITEPHVPVRVVVGRAAALETRARFDRRIAQRLAAGWVPRDPIAGEPPLVAPTPLPADLALLIRSTIEALVAGRQALRVADPTGRLWEACARFLLQARSVGIDAAGARRARAHRERRLGELAEAAGDVPAAILHYRAALAAHRGVGVKHRLALLERHWPTALDDLSAPTRVAVVSDPHSAHPTRSFRRNLTRRSAHGATQRHPAQPVVSEDPVQKSVRRIGTGANSEMEEASPMAKKPIAKVQLVCRIDSALNTRVRVQAARAGQTLTTFIERALAGAVKGKAARLTSDVSVASRVKPRTKRGESEAPRSH